MVCVLSAFLHRPKRLAVYRVLCWVSIMMSYRIHVWHQLERRSLMHASGRSRRGLEGHTRWADTCNGKRYYEVGRASSMTWGSATLRVPFRMPIRSSLQKRHAVSSHFLWVLTRERPQRLA